MKTMISKKNSLVLGLFSLALMSCGSHSELDDVINPTHDDVATISISVKAPASDAVIISKAAAQTSAESKINDMTVYLFKADQSASSDAQYKYHSEHKFEGAALVDGGTNNTTCNMPIPADLFGQTVKIAVVANDAAKLASGQLTANSTTLEAFKKALAGAAVNNNDKADALIGGETSHSFPMSCVIAQEQKLTVTGASFTADLTRNVARLEVFNNVPNLTIKGITINKVNSKSCIFAGEAAALNVPTADLTKISLNPLQSFTTTMGKGLAYKSGNGEAEIKTNNTYTFAYLYEQSVTAGLTDSPEIVVTYELAVDNQGGSIQKPGAVTVKFEKTGNSGKEPVPVKRNHRYTIQLGEGKNVSTGIVSATFNVVDWTNTAEENIESDLTPQKQ